MKLNKPLVMFDEEHHIYTYDGQQLSGITDMLHRQVFPDMYSGVSKDVLDNAAKRGTGVHNTIEMMDNLGVVADTPEAHGYARILKRYDLHVECSEYTVSDYQHFASNIDKVFRVDDTTFDLGDLKTTYKLDTEYVRWQLSVYAYLFEICNPGCLVRNLYAIWLRGDEAKLVEVQRIPAQIIIKLLCAEVNGKQFKNPLKKFPSDLSRMTQRIARAVRQQAYWANEVNEFKKLLERRMEEEQSNHWESQFLSVTKTKDSETTGFDAERFKKDYPELFKAYQKTSSRKGYVKITPLKPEKEREAV